MARSIQTDKASKKHGKKKRKDKDGMGLQATKGIEKRKKRRNMPGSVAGRRLKRSQNETHLLIPRTNFRLLWKECASDYVAGTKIQAKAITAAQWVVENHMIAYMRKVGNAAIHGGRVTIYSKDAMFINAHVL